MTPLLKKAFDWAASLPEEAQDALALVLLDDVDGGGPWTPWLPVEGLDREPPGMDGPDPDGLPHF